MCPKPLNANAFARARAASSRAQARGDKSSLAINFVSGSAQPQSF